VSKDTIGNVSEVDLWGIWHQYSREVVNGMIIQNDLLLIGNAQPAIDFFIGEVKTGDMCPTFPSIILLIQFIGNGNRS